MFLYTVRKKCHDVINRNPYSSGIPRVSASSHMCGPFLISYCGNKLWSGLIEKSKVTNAGPPTRFWGCRGQKYFRCLGEWHKSKFPGKQPRQRATSEKVGGRGMVSLHPSRPPPTNPPPLPFVRGLVMSTKKIRSIERSMTVKQYQHTPGNNKQRELFVELYHSLKLITSRI